MKELPKMYQNKITKKIDSIQKVYNSFDDRRTKENKESDIKYGNISIDKKIENIFTSPEYVYKADVTIITDKETIKRRIVARNKNNIITIDNEYIPISIIRDIYK